jgi:hypothetical protein
MLLKKKETFGEMEIGVEREEIRSVPAGFTGDSSARFHIFRHG